MARPTGRRPAGSSGPAGRTPRPTRPPGRGQGGAGARASGRGRATSTTQGPRRRVALTPRRWVALVSVGFLMTMMLLPTAKSYLDQRSRMDALETQVATQERDVAALQRQKELWSTDEYVEAQARERLKFVKVGEKSYTVIDADPAASDVDPETGTATGEDHGPWYERLGTSVEAADARSEAGR
ncbi:hypothetical protein AWH69_06175 [Janibacter melonis]|uniref:Septum formation initiator family protein n=1 Tax=Janibacter melonis TaxID=262209 RepID=A0A176QD87_9MICO|nr:septum formation initiator family protein [Janibacter melonis]OAB87642.1 hypothetical protein AWH69_06175 [Janibacter melonis]